MKGCEALLLLLLCLSGTEAQGHNGLLNERHTHDQPGDLLQPDLWGELMKLRDMLVVQQEKMRIVEEVAKKQGMFMAGKHGHSGAGSLQAEMCFKTFL